MPATAPSVYLDTCCLQRLHEPAADPRMAKEARSVRAILAACAAGRAELLGSPLLWYEAGLNTNRPVAESVRLDLTRADREAPFGRPAADRAADYNRGRNLRRGSAERDGMHLACAVEAGADVFCTVDDRLLRRAARRETAATVALSPADLVRRLALNS